MNNLMKGDKVVKDQIKEVEVEHNPTDHYLTIKTWDADINFLIIEGDETTYINICDVDMETISNGEINKSDIKDVRDFFITVLPLTTKQALRLAAESLVNNIAEKVVAAIRGE